MRSITEKRKDFMKYLTSVMDLLDPSGENSKLYEKKFSKMSDKQFDTWVRKFFEDEERYLYLEIVEFERDLSLENIEKCAEFMNVPLFERVALPYINGSLDNVIVTPEPVPVGYIHIKRMQQTLLKKNAGSITISKRNPKTGQVIDEDKNARNSDVETYALTTIGADNALREFMGPRADDLHTKSQLYNNISKNGFASLEDLDNNPENKIALNTLDCYFYMQGLSTNLITPLEIVITPKK